MLSLASEAFKAGRPARMVWKNWLSFACGTSNGLYSTPPESTPFSLDSSLLSWHLEAIRPRRRGHEGRVAAPRLVAEHQRPLQGLGRCLVDQLESRGAPRLLPGLAPLGRRGAGALGRPVPAPERQKTGCMWGSKGRGFLPRRGSRAREPPHTTQSPSFSSQGPCWPLEAGEPRRPSPSGESATRKQIA